MSTLFVPYQVQVGATSAVYGMMGTLLIELFQSWEVWRDPHTYALRNTDTHRT